MSAGRLPALSGSPNQTKRWPDKKLTKNAKHFLFKILFLFLFQNATAAVPASTEGFIEHVTDKGGTAGTEDTRHQLASLHAFWQRACSWQCGMLVGCRQLQQDYPVACVPKKEKKRLRLSASI